jgi:hypothetical protein
MLLEKDQYIKFGEETFIIKNTIIKDEWRKKKETSIRKGRQKNIKIEVKKDTDENDLELDVDLNGEEDGESGSGSGTVLGSKLKLGLAGLFEKKRGSNIDNYEEDLMIEQYKIDNLEE